MWDFLFTYYSLRPRQLRRWHPGFGVVLGGAAAGAYLDRTGYGPHPAGVTVTDEHLLARADTVAVHRRAAARHRRRVRRG